jgi:hypothetical protein
MKNEKKSEKSEGPRNRVAMGDPSFSLNFRSIAQIIRKFDFFGSKIFSRAPNPWTLEGQNPILTQIA